MGDESELTTTDEKEAQFRPRDAYRHNSPPTVKGVPINFGDGTMVERGEGNSAVFSPAGFIYATQKKLAIKPIVELDEVYQEYMNRKTNSVSIDLILRFTDVLKKYRLHTLDWIKHNYYSPRLGDGSKDFLDDTIRFIKTGSRPMEIGTRLQLMSFYDSVKELPVDPMSHKRPIETMRFSFDPYNLMGVWASQPNGIYDMICTYHTAFARTDLVI